MRMSPRTKVGYLLAVSLAAFFTGSPALLAALIALQAALWAGSRLPPRDFVRPLTRLIPFAIVVLLLSGLFPDDASSPPVFEWAIRGWRIGWHQEGFLPAVRMILRVLVAVSASAWVQRSGSADDFVAGLRGWLLPEPVAATIASTLTLLGSESRPGMGGGRGSGGGGGRGRGQGAEGPSTLRRLLRGELDFIPGMVDSAVERARPVSAASGAKGSAALVEDVAILSGLCVLMLGTKLTRVLPGIPFLPGYKIALILPLYFVAADRTRMRLGATVAGTALGVISFLFGDGRYGVFEILKHVAPGLVVDAFAPAFPSLRGRIVPFVFIGTLAAAARLSTIMTVVRFIDGSAALYAFAALQGLSQLSFGAVSGIIAARLIRTAPANRSEEAHAGKA